MITHSLSCWSYLPSLIILLLSMHHGYDCAPKLITAPKPNCPRPTPPVFITKSNQRTAFVDDSTYTSQSVSLPLKCTSEDFAVMDSLSATCNGSTWIIPDYKCVQRAVTDKIMIILGVVFGVIAATFVIIKIIFYRRRRNKEKKLQEVLVKGEVELRRSGYVSSLTSGHATPMDRVSARESQLSSARAFHNAAYDPSSVGDPGLNPPQSRPSQYYNGHRRGPSSVDSQYYSHDSRESRPSGSQYISRETYSRDSY